MFYRKTPDGPRQASPARWQPSPTVAKRSRVCIASISTRPAKAPIALPRRALDHLAGHGVRFGPRDADILLVGEGIETVLSMAPSYPRPVRSRRSRWPTSACLPCPRNSRRF